MRNSAGERLKDGSWLTCDRVADSSRAGQAFFIFIPIKFVERKHGMSVLRL